MRKAYYRREIERRRRIRNRIIAIALAGGLVLSGYILFKNKDNNKVSNNKPEKGIEYSTDGVPTAEIDQIVEMTPEPTLEPTVAPTPVPTVSPIPEPTLEPKNGGDTIIATTNVNMRLDSRVDSYKLDVLNAGSIANRLFTDGEWDLISYNGMLAYVHTDYTREYEVDYNNEYYDIEKYDDIARTTTQLYCRLGPSKNEPSIFLLDKDEEMEVMGRVILRNNPSDEWLLVKVRGNIGFVCRRYTYSFRDAILSIDPYVTSIATIKVARVLRDTAILDKNKNIISYVDKYQLAHVLYDYGNYSLVNLDGTIGLISNKDLSVCRGKLFVCDISTQRVYYYVNGEIVFRGRCTTGRDKSPTELGFFTPYGKASSHDFGHDNLVAKILWLPFNGGQGCHDAPWQPDDKFGDPEYRKKSGSAGCIRLPNAEAHYIYDNISQSTPILVKH